MFTFAQQQISNDLSTVQVASLEVKWAEPLWAIRMTRNQSKASL